MLTLLLLSNFKLFHVAGAQGRGLVLHCTVEAGMLFWIDLILDQQQILPPPYALSSWLHCPPGHTEKYRLQRELGRTDCSGMDIEPCKLHHS